ncbi:hypothetical protein VTK73DRAFT_6416 [Phialemonium thermophilum]|uniref:Ribonuclease H2 subunit B wHTH domain-containing protein n=1 Tax=Phialemonium thermophilum TaxID=223376 RepID=A0ABR3UZP5_9PEZI
MEAKFVAKPLEAPFFAPAPSAAPAAAGVVSSSESPSATTDDAGVATPRTETTESQLSTSSAETTDTTETSTSEASTAATSVAASEPGARGTTEELQVAMTPSEEVVRLQRIRVAFDLLCAKYVPPPVAEDLRKALAARTDPVDFGPLQAYLGRLAQLREADVAARSMAEHARKRTREEDDDERAEKRRRKEEEEKRKKGGESRGVRELKKVNVSGMMKLSAFFKKKG